MKQDYEKMKMQEKVNGKWQDIEIAQLKKKGFIDYVADSFNPVLLGLYRDDKLSMIISNDKSVMEAYEEQNKRTGESVYILDADTATLLFSERTALNSLIEVFPNAGFLEIRSITPKKED